MPDGSSLLDHIVLNSDNFYALSWMISVLGKLKDARLNGASSTLVAEIPLPDWLARSDIVRFDLSRRFASLSYKLKALPVNDFDMKDIKIRNYSADCGLDFGGLPLYWLENVNPAQSVQLLSELALAANTATDQKKSANSAISAIALHDDPSADVALEKMIQPGQPPSPQFMKLHGIYMGLGSIEAVILLIAAFALPAIMAAAVKREPSVG